MTPDLFPILLARGRGLGKLIRAAMDGEPWAVGIVALIVAVVVGSLIFKMKKKAQEQAGEVASD